MLSKILTKRNVLITLSIIAIAISLYFIVPVSIPIILALLMAMLIEPLVRFVETRIQISRKVSVISVYIFVISIIILAIYFTVTSLIARIINFVKDAPAHINSLILA